MARVPEPPFTLEAREGAFELRRYGPRVMAETRVEGSWSEAGNQGFRRLADYIFGNNRARTGLAMTAPVASRRLAGRDEGRKLAMTAPVGERAAADGWLVSFTMPEGETLESLPRPVDGRVSLRQLPPTRVAVVRFSGRWTEECMQAQTETLRRWLAGRGLRPVGDAEVNRYDPPWTPWFMRRNEVWLELEPG